MKLTHSVHHSVYHSVPRFSQIQQKVLQLACKLVRYGFTKIHYYIFPMEYKIYTDKLPAAATVHFLGAKIFVHACLPL